MQTTVSEPYVEAKRQNPRPLVSKGGCAMHYKRLHRSRRNRILAGVCGGIGEYLNIDPVLIRILAVVIPGIGWVTYLICALLMPSE